MSVSLKQDHSVVATVITDPKGEYGVELYNTGIYVVEPVKEGSSFSPANTTVVLTKGNKGNVNFKQVQ